jgi:Intron-binding protein aquarius N-terminus
MPPTTKKRKVKTTAAAAAKKKPAAKKEKVAVVAKVSGREERAAKRKNDAAAAEVDSSSSSRTSPRSPSWLLLSLDELYRKIVLSNKGGGSSANGGGSIGGVVVVSPHERRAALSQLNPPQIWLELVRFHEEKRKNSKEEKLSKLLAALLSHGNVDGGVHPDTLQFISSDDQQQATWEAWCDCIFSSSSCSKESVPDATSIHTFLISWSCLDQQPEQQSWQRQQLLPALQRHVRDWHRWMPVRYRELYLRLRQNDINKGVEGEGGAGQKAHDTTPPFVVRVILHALHVMEGETLTVRSNSRKDLQSRQGLVTEPVLGDARVDQEEDEGDEVLSDDVNDEENNDGLDGQYDDEGVEGTDYVPEQQQNQDNAGGTGKEEREDGVDGTHEQQQHVGVAEEWRMIHRALELLCNLLSAAPIREELIAFLHSIHWTVRARTAIGTSTYSSASSHMLLAQQLLERAVKWIHGFPINSSSSGGGQQPLDAVQRLNMYHDRGRLFQKMCQRHVDLPEVLFAGVGLLCTAPVHGKSYLRDALSGLTDDQFADLMHRMRLVDIHSRPETFDRSFLVEVLEDYLVVPQDPLEELQTFPLYPTERVLWDFSRIPPSHSNLLPSPVLSLPKLTTRFLSFADYLLRNFELVRLESAHEIRSDLVDAIRRLRPVVRQVMHDDEDQYMSSSDTVLKTEFSGWARMALEMQGKLEIKRVRKPLLGERFPSQVVAEIVIDLQPCGEAIRKEWDQLGEHDNLFLVGIDAQQMSGKQAPLLRDYHLNAIGSEDSKPRISDEDDRTFPERFGVTLVRGVMILHVRDGEGTILSDPTNEIRPSGTRRIFQVALDPAQYHADLKGPSGSDIYNGLNLVVRRDGKTDNFRSILETIRGLMAGTGSINRVIPPWLQRVLLGHGNPEEASYLSETMKTYANATPGVAGIDSFLDFGDTFVDEDHLRNSFVDSAREILVDGRKKAKKSEPDQRFCYRVRATKQGEIQAESYRFPDGVKGNPVPFTPRQVAAVRAGLSPGLSLVVGPPGTGA